MEPFSPLTPNHALRSVLASMGRSLHYLWSQLLHLCRHQDSAKNCGFRSCQSPYGILCGWTPQSVIVTIGDNRDYIRVLLYSYYTTIVGWRVLLRYYVGYVQGLERTTGPNCGYKSLVRVTLKYPNEQLLATGFFFGFQASVWLEEGLPTNLTCVFFGSV